MRSFQRSSDVVGKKLPSFPETRQVTSKGSVPKTGSMPATGQKGGQSGGSGTKS